MEGCEKAYVSKGYCRYHYDRYIKGLPVVPERNVEDPLTWPRFIVGGYVVRSTTVNGMQKKIAEHRVVMEVMLGRPLLPGENVHHINGDKVDNRPENLELWSTSQPSGQRVMDKVAWAKALLALYEPECLTLVT